MEDSRRHFSKDDMPKASRQARGRSRHPSSGKHKWKPRRHLTSHLSGRLKPAHKKQEVLARDGDKGGLVARWWEGKLVQPFREQHGGSQTLTATSPLMQYFHPWIFTQTDENTFHYRKDICSLCSCSIVYNCLQVHRHRDLHV